MMKSCKNLREVVRFKFIKVVTKDELRRRELDPKS